MNDLTIKKKRINVKAKGSAFENVMSKWLYENLGIEAKRNLNQTRDGGADIITDWFCIECKRTERLNLSLFWLQCAVATKKYKIKRLLPVVVFKQNRKPLEFLLPASLVPGCGSGYIRISEAIFIKFAKEVMYDKLSFDRCVEMFHWSNTGG